MDLGQKTPAELRQLSHFAESLIDELRSVDDTDELRLELTSFRDSCDLELGRKLRM
jgi:hypothetical protein